MGEIRRYICKCEYNKDIYAGGGLLGCNVKHIAKFFPEEVKPFTKERELGQIESFGMENKLVFCKSCRDIVAVPEFSYKKTNGQVCRFMAPCPDCGGQVSPLEDESNILCPKCGRKLEYDVLGDWD